MYDSDYDWAWDERGTEVQPYRGGGGQGEGRRTWVPPDPEATLRASLTCTNDSVKWDGHDIAGGDRGSSQLSAV